jgi:hypothetical protein
MKLPLDPSHLEMPAQVAVAVGGFCSSLALAGWQMLGDMFTQLPTPKDMTGWQEKHVYLWIALIAFVALGVVLRWIAGQFMCALNNNTAAMNNNTSAMNTFNAKVESLVVPAMQHAMDEAFRGDTPIPRSTLATSRKRQSDS